MQTINIRVPRSIHTKERKKIDPFFKVDTIGVHRDDGYPLNLRALVNHSTSATLSVVSDQYKLTTHAEASRIVKSFLDDINVKYEIVNQDTSNAGARFFETLILPDFKFNPTKGIASTAIDNEGATFDDHIPTITVRNSYDRTSPVSWSYGFFRTVCSNGLANLVHEERLGFRHSQKLDIGRIQYRLLHTIEESTKSLSDIYERLNGVSGQVYLDRFLESKISDKIKLSLLEKIAPRTKLEIEDVKDVDTKRVIRVVRNAKTELSGYAVLQVVTEINTHEITNRYEQEVNNGKIARLFQEVA